MGARLDVSRRRRPPNTCKLLPISGVSLLGVSGQHLKLEEAVFTYVLA